MAVTQVREQVERVQFREVAGSSKQNLHIANHEANHVNSMKALADNGLRPLTYQEAFARSSELIAELKGKWFYLDGQGIENDGIYTYNNKGELTEVTGGESIDQKVRVWSGNRSLSLCVLLDDDARSGGRRFFLIGYVSPNVVAPVVVGVKQAQAGSVATTQKNEEFASLLRVGEGQSIVLTYPNGMKTETRVPEGTTVHIE